MKTVRNSVPKQQYQPTVPVNNASQNKDKMREFNVVIQLRQLISFHRESVFRQNFEKVEILEPFAGFRRV